MKEVPPAPPQELLGKRIFGVAFAHPKVLLYPHGDPCPIHTMQKKHCHAMFFRLGDARGTRSVPLAKPPWRSQGVGVRGIPSLCDFGQMLPLGDICRVRPNEVRLYICTRRTSSAFEMVSPRIENIFKFQFIAIMFSPK